MAIKRVKKLSQHLANQIAAGEVVECPASIVKELIENSIDAEASEIVIKLQQGGIEGIEIEDNGKGIHPDDLQLCLASHTTSKLSSTDDLTHIETLGFRGEALSSIQSVARIEVLSKVSSAEHAWLLNTQGERQPSSRQQGTSIRINELFYNIPARKKFLRSASTELRHCLLIINRIALIRTDICFTVYHNQKQTLHYEISHSQKKRLSSILGKEFADSCIPINTQYGQLSIQGFLGSPHAARRNADKQFWYVNQRPIRDRALAVAVKRAYADVMYQQLQPVYTLSLTIPTDQVDINVHPSKEEARFINQELFLFTQSSVKAALGQLLQSKQTTSEPSNVAKIFERTKGFSNTPITKPSTHLFSQSAKTTTYNKGTTQKSLGRIDRQSFANLFADGKAMESNAVPANISLGQALAFIHSNFILASNDDGLIIVDAHAAHERVLYEQLKQKQKIIKQTLLSPIEVPLTLAEQGLYKQLKPHLQQAGFDIKLTQENWLISSVPTCLEHCDIHQLLQDVISDFALDNSSNVIEETLYTKLSSKACHQAVRANRYMSIPEMNDLLRQIEQAPSGSQCNHGRPTWKLLHLAELNRLFSRGQ